MKSEAHPAPQVEPKEPQLMPKKRRGLSRWLPLVAIVAAMAAAWGLGLHEYLSLRAIGQNYQELQTLIADNFVLALLGFLTAYIVVVALSLPGALFMTLAGGLLFGPYVGIPIIVVAATIGATLIFLVARTSLGEALAARADPSIEKLRAGFQENALSYMLFLRLVPVFPFFVVNLAPAFLGVSLRTFLIGTLLGIIPGTTAYALVGASLVAPLEAENARYAACVAAQGESACTYSIDLSQLVSRELILASIALGIVALIPVAFNWFRKRNRSNAKAQ